MARKLITWLFLILLPTTLWAQTLTHNFDEGFIINADNTTGVDMVLQFGESLAEYLKWDDIAAQFEISDTLKILGDLNLAGEVIDSSGNSGTNGQVFSANGDGTNEWRNVSASSANPYISTSGSIKAQPNSSRTFTLDGLNFAPTATVSIPGFGGTIDSVTVNSPTEIDVTVTTDTTEAIYDIIVANGALNNTAWTGNGVGLFQIQSSNWTDLRAGGATLTHGNGAGNDIRYHSGMNLVRDADGMYFTGSSPWGSWVKFEFMGWTRGTEQTLEWIFSQPAGSMMIGIGSDATNETSSAQYGQAEVEAYFNNSTAFWGLYGNSGNIGSAGNQINGATIGSGTYKIRFTGDGDAGDQFTLFQLPSADPSDWDDESNVVTTFTIGGSLNPDETNIMPFIIPRDGDTQRFIAVKVD